MNRWALILIAVLGGCDQAPDAQLSPPAFDELANAGTGFTQAEPGLAVKLPDDMGSHPDYRIEWWYLTANLKSPDGEAFGVQWTLFRLGLNPQQAGVVRPPGWHNDELWLAHVALSRMDQHRFASRAARGGTGQAGVTAAPFAAWIDQWQLVAAGEEGFRLQVKTDTFAYQLQITPTLPAVLQGDRGFSAKSAQGGGSMYFSYPALEIKGEVALDGQRFEVSGRGWFDREWSSQYLQPDQQGWDWLGLHLEDGRHLMVFRMRGAALFHAGTLIESDGRARPLSPDAFSLVPQEYRDSAQGKVPVRWQLLIPAEGLALEINAWPGEYWNPGRLSYWEGPVDISGSHTGEGYLEMTGYGD